MFKHVPTYINESEILNDIQQTFPSCTLVERFKKGGNPLQVVLVSFSSIDDVQNIISDGVFINNLFLQPEKFIPKIKPTRCFKCNKFGHVANLCKNNTHCCKCGSDQHSQKDCSSQSMKCVNCDGNHAASDTKCPIYIELFKSLNNNTFL